jgi:hypothetical protein
MSGLNLVGALQGYQQGKAWADNQKLVEQQQKQAQIIKDSNAAGAASMQQAQDADTAKQQQAWTDSGNDPSAFKPQPYQPDSMTVLNAMHARGDAIAKSGDLDLWTQHEAATAPLRNSIRQQVIGKALADYNATGDGAALASTVYPTIHDGTNIQAIKTDPTGGLGMQGASQAVAAGQTVKPAYQIQLTNGQSHTLTGDQIASMAHDAMIDPQKAAQYEYEARLLGLKNQGEIGVAQAKAAAEGDQARQTEGVKGQNAMTVEGLRSSTSLAVGKGNNAATVQAAGILGDSRVDAAGLRSSGGADGGKKVQSRTTDASGHVVLNFRDGTSALATINGQPILSGDYAKRVDSMTKVIAGSIAGLKMTPAQQRAAAEQTLSGSTAAPAAGAGLVGAPPAPASGGKDFSNLWGSGQ